jgi:metallo-beta-lactamase class B
MSTNARHIIIFALLLSSIPGVSAMDNVGVDTIRVSDAITLFPLTTGIYIHVSDAELPGFGRFSSNGMVLVSDGKVLLIDTPVNDTLTAMLVSWITDSMRVKITGFVATHWHSDCMGGLGYLHRLGIPSYAHAKTIAIATQKKLPVPQHGFEDTLTLPLGKKVIECFYPGPGHSMDNIVVCVPDDKILFGGCLVKALDAQGPGNTVDGDVHAWPGSIDRVMQQFSSARIVVPGHGAFGGIELLRHTAELLKAVSSR